MLDDIKNYSFTNNEKMLLNELEYHKQGLELNFFKNKFQVDKSFIEKIIFNLNKKGFIELFNKENKDFIKIKE